MQIDGLRQGLDEVVGAVGKRHEPCMGSCNCLDELRIGAACGGDMVTVNANEVAPLLW